MEEYMASNDELRIDTLMLRQAYAELLDIQLERAKLRLKHERGERDFVKRVIFTSCFIVVLISVWF